MFSVHLRQFGSVGGTWALVLSVTVLLVAPLRAQPATENKADQATAQLRARLALAQKGYESAIKGFVEIKQASTGTRYFTTRPEEVYAWSIRWLEAARAVNPKDAAQITALEEHLKRVTKLETWVKRFVPSYLPETAALDAEWYRLEAELWLAQAKRKKQ